MKTSRFTILLLLIFQVVSGRADVDHLVPINPTWSPEFRAILAKKLGPTAFDCGRVIVEPPFQRPEESVSVYSREMATGQRAYFVTYMVAEKNIREITDGADFPERGNDIKIRRIDAEIPKKTAEVIREVWLRMLEAVSGHFPPEGEEREVIPGDATLIEFSLQRSPGAPICGQLNVFLDNQRSKVKGLMSLTDHLITYCQAQADERPSIANRIELDAKHLLAQLQASHT